MKGKTVAAAIAVGALDASLDDIAEAVRLRQKAVARQTAASVSVGARVRLNDKVRPRRMIGAVGVVTKVNEASVMVRFEERDARFGGECRVSVTLIELVGETQSGAGRAIRVRQ